MPNVVENWPDPRTAWIFHDSQHAYEASKMERKWHTSMSGFLAPVLSLAALPVVTDILLLSSPAGSIGLISHQMHG